MYARLREDPLHWNIDRLRLIRVESVSPHTPSAHDLLAIWSGTLARHTLPTADRRDMESYIQTLYGLDEDAFRGWTVLVRHRDSPSNAQAYVPELCEALLWCPDRQMACLTMLYAALHSTQDTGTFEYFVGARRACRRAAFWTWW